MLRGLKWFFLLAAAATLGFLLCRLNRSTVPPQLGNLVGQHWQRMTTSEKIYFLQGFKRGSGEAHSEACRLFGRREFENAPRVLGPGDILQDPCEARSMGWPMGTWNLMLQIDEFYRRYPEDSSLMLENLIVNLSDKRGLTIEQIHRPKISSSPSPPQ